MSTSAPLLRHMPEPSTQNCTAWHLLDAKQQQGSLGTIGFTYSSFCFPLRLKASKLKHLPLASTSHYWRITLKCLSSLPLKLQTAALPCASDPNSSLWEVSQDPHCFDWQNVSLLEWLINEIGFCSRKSSSWYSRINSFPSSYHVHIGKALDWVLSMCWDNLFLWLSLRKRWLVLVSLISPAFVRFPPDYGEAWQERRVERNWTGVWMFIKKCLHMWSLQKYAPLHKEEERQVVSLFFGKALSRQNDQSA